MTEKEKIAFGFTGKNYVWDQILETIQQMQEQAWMHATSVNPKGEDRIHACGQSDGINMVYSMLITLRQEARKLNGLTVDEDLA